MIPREEGIEGWLWTSTGGTALTNLGEDDEAPNVALVFTKPLDEAVITAAFDPEFVSALAARSPLGAPTVLGVLFRVVRHPARDAGLPALGLPGHPHRPRDPAGPAPAPADGPPGGPDGPRRGNADEARAKTSVAPPGF